MIYLLIISILSMLFPDALSVMQEGTTYNLGFLGGVITGLSALTGGLIGNSQAESASARAAGEAARMRQAAMAEIAGMKDIYLPDLNYTPEMMEYLQAADPLKYGTPKDVEGTLVEDSPETRAMQMQAMEEIQQRATEGMTAQEKYNFMKNRRDAETAARGREQAIMQNLQARGMGGSGIEAAMRMMGSQAEMDRLAETQAMQAAENANMKMKATQVMGGMAGDIRGQDIGVSMSNADILNQLAWNNSQRKAEIANRNIDLQNEALRGETQERRNISSANVDLTNQKRLLDAQQRQTQSEALQESQREKAKLKAAAQTGGIKDVYAQGAADAGRAQDLWSSIGKVPGTIYQSYQASQDRDADRALKEKQALYGTQEPVYLGYNNPYKNYA